MANVQLSHAESWEKIHEAFTQVNFNAFDYATVKQSLIEYMKLYHPETFNDMIESSEFIALLELFCYVAELAAYRVDMNAQENFITTANRKESVLRLAKFISYKPSRNIPARGLVKLISVSTTEIVYDSVGRNLANIRINWNDPNNPNWKEHFILVLNKVLEQPFGTVNPDERKQFENVLFELYSLNNNPMGTKTVFSYSASVTNQALPMEVVPVDLTDDGPQEKRPENNAKFTLLYGSDGLGDSSDLTGFFMFTKQGTLQKVQAQFDGVTPNQTFEINVNNVNETDVWINNVDPNTRSILISDPYANILPHLSSTDSRYGEWFEVDISNAQNIIFNTNKNRKKYEIETLDNDQVKIIFGDGEFADIPSGSFDIWYRTSMNADTPIPRSAVIDNRASFSYTDANTQTQTFTFSFSLVSSLQNSSASEDIQHIKDVAPSVYYTQDRMVNGRDYNTFMLKDPSILKMIAINRTFAGDSKYMTWHDPSETYENVKIYGDDLALYWDDRLPSVGASTTVNFPYSGDVLLTNYVEPLLSATDFFLFVTSTQHNTISVPLRKSLTPDENTALSAALDNAAQNIGGATANVYYDYDNDAFSTTGTLSQWFFEITATFIASEHKGWVVNHRTKRLITYSEKTKFWNTNTTEQVVNYDSLSSVKDNITILKANPNGTSNNILSSNKIYPILGQCLLEQPLESIGLPDVNRLSVITSDATNDGIPDDVDQTELMVYKLENAELTTLSPITTPSGVVITLPKTFISGRLDEEVTVYLNSSTTPALIEEYLPVSGTLNNKVTLLGVMSTANAVTIIIKNFVYFTRLTSSNDWKPTTATLSLMLEYATSGDTSTLTRKEGRYPLNFGWFHYVQQYNLVDPAASNITDMFIMTRGYYQSYQQWVLNKTTVKPSKPSSLSLRTSYASLLNNAMISDTVILHSADFKVLFGSKATLELQCKFKIIRPTITSLTDNELKVRVVEIIRNFFDVNDWDFGQTFYFTQLAAVIQTSLPTEIESIVLVPTNNTKTFGDLFQVSARENELFIPDVTTSDIEIVQSFTSENINQS